VAIHLAILIAVLVELLHVVLHQVGGAVRIIGTVDEGLFRVGMLSVDSQLACIHPVAPGDAENAAGALFRLPVTCLLIKINAYISNAIFAHKLRGLFLIS